MVPNTLDVVKCCCQENRHLHVGLPISWMILLLAFMIQVTCICTGAVELSQEPLLSQHLVGELGNWNAATFFAFYFGKSTGLFLVWESSIIFHINHNIEHDHHPTLRSHNSFLITVFLIRLINSRRMKATGLTFLMSIIFSLVGNLVRVYIVYGILYTFH